MQVAYTTFIHKSFSYIACRVWINLPPQVREASDLKSLVAKLMELNLVQDEWLILCVSVGGGGEGGVEGGWGWGSLKKGLKRTF